MANLDFTSSIQQTPVSSYMEAMRQRQDAETQIKNQEIAKSTRLLASIDAISKTVSGVTDSLLEAKKQRNMKELLSVMAQGKTPSQQAAIRANPTSATQQQNEQTFSEKTTPVMQAKPFVNLKGETIMASPDASGKFNVPEGFLDPTIARAKVFSQPRVEANTIRKEQFTEGQWNKLEKSVNALDKGARSSVGMAAVGNQRAARALAVLNDPNMDTVKLRFVMADLAGIMQGGAPHEIMLRQAGYDNAVTAFATLKQKITAEPQVINVPEIRQQLKDTISEIMNVDNQILDTNVGIAKEGFLKAIETDPKRFERMTKALDKVKTVGQQSTSSDQSAAKAALRKKLGL